jgi:hypothetical protein
MGIYLVLDAANDRLCIAVPIQKPAILYVDARDLPGNLYGFIAHQWIVRSYFLENRFTDSISLDIPKIAKTGTPDH